MGMSLPVGNHPLWLADEFDLYGYSTALWLGTQAPLKYGDRLVVHPRVGAMGQPIFGRNHSAAKFNSAPRLELPET